MIQSKEYLGVIVLLALATIFTGLSLLDARKEVRKLQEANQSIIDMVRVGATGVYFLVDGKTVNFRRVDTDSPAPTN